MSLGYFQVNGRTVRLAQGALSIPASLAGVVSGVVGVNEYVATTDLALESHNQVSRIAKPKQEPAPPAGFRNPQPCSSYFGQKIDTKDAASLYAPYTAPLPYDICGYLPRQLRGAYGLSGAISRGNDGNGVAIAIVDAYDSPTLLSDAQRYFRMNDPAIPAEVEPVLQPASGLGGRSGGVRREWMVRRAGSRRRGLPLHGPWGGHHLRGRAGLPGHEPSRCSDRRPSRVGPRW